MTRIPSGGLPELLAHYDEDKKIEDIVNAVARHESVRNSAFTAEMRQKLVTAAMPLKGMTGFTAEFVSTMAASVYLEVLGEDVAPWFPSTAWTYKFLHEDLHCSLRRGTSSRPNIEVIAETDALHLRNLRRIGLLRADCGYEDWQFMTNDQFGSHLFPQHRSVWTDTGAEDVFLEGFDDKRQYTGNICGCGDGHVRRGLLCSLGHVHTTLFTPIVMQLLAVHMIHEGLSEVAIPSVRDDDRVKNDYKDWLFSHTDNHWANLEVTKDFTKFCYDRFIRRWMEKKGVNEVSRLEWSCRTDREAP